MPVATACKQLMGDIAMKATYLKTHSAKKWVRRLSFGMLLVPIAACGSGTKESGEKLEEIPKSSGPVNLVFYSTSGWSPEAFNERFGDAMRKKFPNYNIEYIRTGQGTTFPDLISAGKEIDVYWHDVNTAIPHLLEYKLEYDMTGLIKQFGVDLSTFEPTSVNIAKQMSGGKMYAIPLVINTAAFYYNKDIFDRFGVPYLKDGVKWDEVQRLAKLFRRTDNGQEYYGVASASQPQFNLTSLAVPFIDPKTGKAAILTDDRWKTIYNQLIEFRKSTDNKAMAVNFGRDKNVAMLDDIANTFLNSATIKTLNWDMVTYPTFKDEPDIGPQTLPTFFGITSTSKHKYEAMEVLKHMLSEEQQLSLSERAIIPVLQKENVLKAFGSKSNFKDKNLQAIVKRKFTPSPPKTNVETKSRTIYDKPLADLVI
jgi:ABC-type glycerol-3-phosphate transport system substrate-binding protein